MEYKIKETYKIFDKYNLSEYDKKILWDIINPIFVNPNFQKRMSEEFYHHDNVSLGHHIIADATVTYKICQKQKYKIINTKLAVIIAMMHDLYTMPWQNNSENNSEYISNKHGFRHPIEAVINAITWFPEYFENETQSRIIIDGIIHHMFPLPVRKIDDLDLELKNHEYYDKLPEHLKQLIIDSTNKGFIFNHFSFSPCIYHEGKIVGNSDKKVAIIDDSITTIKTRGFKCIFSFLSLITGVNKNIKE